MSRRVVHVFITSGRFRSFDEVRMFVHKTYTPDGDGIPSTFMLEVGLANYEPGSIECVHRPHPVPLAELLHGASYSEQWLQKLDPARVADASICVFPPNDVLRPGDSSLEYLGALPITT